MGCAVIDVVRVRLENKQPLIFTEVARGIDTWLWFVETSQQADRQLIKEERCSAEAERSDTDGSFNAFGNAPALSLRAEDMMRRGVLRKERKGNEIICNESYRASGVQ